jgi:uncharacterized protein YkwD
MNPRSRILFGICLILLFSSIIGFAQSNKIDKADYLSLLEKEIVRELNMARLSPRDYASLLEKWKPYYNGKLLKVPGEVAIKTKEGVSALNEAIRSIRSMNPVPRFRLSKGMSLGARDHVKDQGSSGSTQHKGRDGSQPWDRVNRYGTWQKIIGENISFGHNRARNVVMTLIIDDGVPDRGHRKNIFNSDFRVTGVACGPHSTYKTICVITFAGGYQEKN